MQYINKTIKLIKLFDVVIVSVNMGKKYTKNGFLKKRKNRKMRRRKRVQKGGAFGAGMALGMFLPQILGTASNILKINV